MYAHKMYKRFKCANRCLRKKIRFNKWHIFLTHIHIKQTHTHICNHYLNHFHRLSSKTISWAFFMIKLIKLADALDKFSLMQILQQNFYIPFTLRSINVRENEWEDCTTYYKNAHMKWQTVIFYFTAVFVYWCVC